MIWLRPTLCSVLFPPSTYLRLHCKLLSLTCIFICSSFTAVPRDRNAWNAFDLNGAVTPFNPNELVAPISTPTPLSPLTPLSQLMPLTELEQTHVVSAPSTHSVATSEQVYNTIASKFDPTHPLNRHFDPPRNRSKNSRWTELQRTLASKAEQPSSLPALESRVCRCLCLSSCRCY